MIVAVIVLAVALAVLVVALAAAVRAHAAERQQWINERRALTDRIIARHIGEVIALDRAAAKNNAVEREEAPLIEGLT